MARKIVAISHGHEMDTPGKRTPAIPELQGRVIHENEFNHAVAQKLGEILLLKGFTVIDVSSTKSDSLEDRVRRANDAGADIFVAIHYNAYDGKFDDYDPEGISVHIYGKGGEAEKLAKAVHAHLIKGTVQRDRGIVVNNFYVLRNTKMPAILTENGFMDNKREAILMLDVDFQNEVAEEHARGICDYYGIDYDKASQGTPIIAESTSTMKQAQAWAKSKNASQAFIDLAPLFYIIASNAGVNPTGAYAQSAKETGYGNFGGVLNASYKNPCGMKNTGGGGNYDPDAHKRFDSWNDGISAQVDHLALYAGAVGYPKVGTLDPRHFPYIKGVAPNWEDLGGRWAGSKTYGTSIVKMMKDIENTVVEVEQPKPTDVEEPKEYGAGWDKAILAGVTQGLDPDEVITAAKLMGYAEELGILDILILLDQRNNKK